MHPCRLLPALLGFTLACVHPLALAVEPAPAPVPTPRQAFQKALTYVTNDGIDWMETRRCASCHHAPMTLWSLSEVKHRGFDIDEKALREIAGWAMSDKVQKDVIPDPAKDKPDVNSTASVAAFLTLGLRAMEKPPAGSEDCISAYTAHLQSKQLPDGSWTTFMGWAPILERPETATLYILASLAKADPKPAAAQQALRDRAWDWLSSNFKSRELQPRLWRLWMRKLRGEDVPKAAATPDSEVQKEIAAILALQNPDGSWSPNATLGGDAFITGQVLFFLTQAAGAFDTASAGRALTFLAKTQLADGSWPIASRPREDLDKKPAKDPEIIRYAAACWGLMGMAQVLSPE